MHAIRLYDDDLKFIENDHSPLQQENLFSYVNVMQGLCARELDTLY